MRIRLLLITSLFLALPALAEPPARVVRLNLTTGAVSFRPAGIDDWTDATINRPLIDGDELWTDASARAEMHIGSAAVRLAGSTSFGIVSETDQVAQLRLSSGTMNVRVRHLDDEDVWEIDTPNAVVSLLQPGRYRVDVSEDGMTTTVTTRGGEAEVTAGDNAFAVREGEQAQISGDTDPTHDVDDAPYADAFDRWCGDRDLREERVASLRYIPADLVGYEDLDANGQWRFVAEYGWVWSPTVVVAGWAPYRYGHWAWVEPWGWTWIDDARWGFAPFHYGRWAYADGGWFWVPGHVERPVYAPALVVFGGGPGWRAGVSIGTVAWWPLAPGEAYVPSYRVSQAYVRNINAPFVNVTNININAGDVHYRNQRVAGGVTAVSQATFITAKPIGAARLTITASEAIAARPIGTAAPVAPAPASVLGGTARANWIAPRPPQTIAARPVIAKNTPPPAPISFTTRQQVLSQNPGQPLNENAERQLRVTSPTVQRTIVQPTVQPAPHTYEAPKEKRVLRPAWNGTPQPSNTTTTAPVTTSAPSWHRATTPPPATNTTSEPSWRRSNGSAPVTTTSGTSTSSATSTSEHGSRKKPEKEEKKPVEKKKVERNGSEKKD